MTHETFGGTFEIVAGSGSKGFEGLGGEGKLKLDCELKYDDAAREAFGSGWGTCVFEGMNEVGASLV